MGVRGLITYIRNHLQEVCCQVNLQCQENVIIVVDGNAFAYWLYFKNILHWVCDYVKIHNSLIRVLSEFHAAGIILVFVFDGPTDISKLRTKLARQYRHAMVCARWPSVTDVVYPPPLIIQCIINVLSGFYVSESVPWGHVCVFSRSEADSDLIAVAVQQGACGILSNDSDMLVHTSREDIGLIPFWMLSCDDGICASIITKASLSRSLGIASEVTELVSQFIPPCK